MCGCRLHRRPRRPLFRVKISLIKLIINILQRAYANVCVYTCMRDYIPSVVHFPT